MDCPKIGLLCRSAAQGRSYREPPCPVCPEDVEQVQELVGQLLGSTDPDNASSGGSMAADGRRGTTYAERFPNAGRLGRRIF